MRGAGPYRAFTLIEMLVVIAIISILIALLLPAIQKIQENSDKTKCLSNLRQISQAAMTYFGDLGEGLPYLGDNQNDWDKFGRAAALLMPYLKYQAEIFDCPANPGIDREHNWEITNAPGFYTEYEFNGFLCCYGTDNRTRWRRQNGIFDYSQAAYAYDHPYLPYATGGYNPDRDRPHRGGINVAYLDGHAAWLPDADMGPLAPSQQTTEKTFYNRGHSFWK